MEENMEKITTNKCPKCGYTSDAVFQQIPKRNVIKEEFLQMLRETEIDPNKRFERAVAIITNAVDILFNTATYEKLREKGIPPVEDYLYLLLHQLTIIWDKIQSNEYELENYRKDIDNLKKDIEEIKKKRLTNDNGPSFFIVACEKCQSKFRLDQNKIKRTGSKVRCSKCDHQFIVQQQNSS